MACVQMLCACFERTEVCALLWIYFLVIVGRHSKHYGLLVQFASEFLSDADFLMEQLLLLVLHHFAENSQKWGVYLCI